MFKKILVCFMVIGFSAAGAFAKPPKLSGGVEQGERYPLPYTEEGEITPWAEATEDDEAEAWAYTFNKGYLQLAQTINDRLRYVVKHNYVTKDFTQTDNTNKNIINYYRAYTWIKLSSAFDLKLEYYLRHQNYFLMPWDNMTYVPHMVVKWNISDKRVADFNYRFKVQRYDDPAETWKDKNETFFNLGYKEEIKSLTLRTEYKYIFRGYTANPDEANAAKKSLSVGFDYQF